MDVIQIVIVQGVVDGADVGEGKVLAGYPAGGFSLTGGTDVIIVHGTQFLVVYAEVDHVGAIGSDLIGQPIHVGGCAVNAVDAEINAVVVVLTAAKLANGDQGTAGSTENIGSAGPIGVQFAGKQHAIATGTGGFPLYDPRKVMLQHHRSAGIDRKSVV